MCLGKLFRKIANKAVGSVMGNDLSQDLTVAEGERYVTPASARASAGPEPRAACC